MPTARRHFVPNLIFIAVFCVSILAAVSKNFQSHPPFAEQAAIATHLYLGHGFRSPFDDSANAPMTSWTPPVYPGMIAGVYQIFGYASPASITCLMLINSGCYAAIALGLYVLGGLVFSRGMGIIAAVLIAAHPLFLNFSSDFWDSFAALAIFAWLTVGAARGIRSRRGFVVMGIAMGALSLTNASYVFAYPILVWIASRSLSPRERAGREGTRRASRANMIWVSFIAFLLTLTPWTLRNAIQFHRVFYVRAGASFEIAMGNQSFATGWMEPAILSLHPARNRDQKAFLLSHGEPAFFDRSRKLFFDEYETDPNAFWARTARRACYLFLSEPTKASQYPFMQNIRWNGYLIDQVLLNSLFTTLGLAGAWTAFRLGYKTNWILLAGLAAEVPFFFASVGDRYTLPLRCALIFFTAFCIWAAGYRLMRKAWPAPALVSAQA